MDFLYIIGAVWLSEAIRHCIENITGLVLLHNTESAQESALAGVFDMHDN